MRAGLSLRELARQLRVSPSFVSQLENGKSQPSVATLYSLAQLLDLSIDDLFEPREKAPSAASPETSPAATTALPPPDTRNDDRMLRHDGYEYGVLLEGELQITVGFEVFTLHAGQAIGFDSMIPHLFKNLGSVPARAIWFVHHRH